MSSGPLLSVVEVTDAAPVRGAHTFCRRRLRRFWEELSWAEASGSLGAQLARPARCPPSAECPSSVGAPPTSTLGFCHTVCRGRVPIHVCVYRSHVPSGDLGTLIPLLIAMAKVGSIDFAAALLFGGLANICVGFAFDLPLPVQPMKAIAGAAIAHHMNQSAVRLNSIKTWWWVYLRMACVWAGCRIGDRNISNLAAIVG